MPFKSEAQRRKFHVLESEGKMPHATVEHWEHATKDKKHLPYHKGHKKACDAYGIKGAGAIEDLRASNMKLNAGNIARGGPSLLQPRTNTEHQQQQLDVRSNQLRGQQAAMQRFGIQAPNAPRA